MGKAEEELLNFKELYEFIKEDAKQAKKAKGVLEQTVEHLKVEAIPL